MKTFLTFVFIAVSICGLWAQTESTNSLSSKTDATSDASSSILMKNGQSVPAQSLQRKDDMLTVAVTTSAGGAGRVSYYVSDVAKLNLPPPPELATASDLIAKGHAYQALAQIEPVFTFQQTLRDIPGNWWAKTALVKSSALLALNQTANAASVLKDIMSFSSDPEIQVAAKLQLILLNPPKDPNDALSAYDSVINQSFDPKTLTQAWLAKGDILFTQHEFEEALMAYLTVTVFYPDHNSLVPKALWGVAQSYAKLKDIRNQINTLHELTSNYPNTPEASFAQAELMKKEDQP